MLNTWTKHHQVAYLKSSNVLLCYFVLIVNSVVLESLWHQAMDGKGALIGHSMKLIKKENLCCNGDPRMLDTAEPHEVMWGKLHVWSGASPREWQWRQKDKPPQVISSAAKEDEHGAGRFCFPCWVYILLWFSLCLLCLHSSFWEWECLTHVISWGMYGTGLGVV